MAQGEKRPVVMEAAKGVPGGVASLGADGKVPQEQLPEFVPITRKINNKALSSDVSLNAADVGAALALHKHPASDITSGTLPISRGGTGKTSVGGTDYTTVRFRGSGLRNADTNPTDNGTINWTYG